MKIRINADGQYLIVRPTVKSLVGLGVSLAVVKMAYDTTYAAYIASVRKLHKQLPDIQDKVEDTINKLDGTK